MNANYPVSLCLLLSISGSLYAEQGCAPGFYPGGAQPNGPICVPIPGYGTSSSAVPQPRGSQWQLTWGAIASDSETGATGVTVGHFSKGKAKREALAQCASIGGVACKIVLAYKNQCAVIADPVENGQAVAGAGISQGGPSIAVATELAISSCSAKNDGRECKIVYSDCTVPVLVN